LRVPEIVSHRGAGQGFVQPETPPENTLPGFEWAWHHADAAELDVRLTRDCQLIVIHDAGTRRTTNADWLVAEHTLAELQTLDAGSWKSPRYAGVRLPSLAEVIAAVPRGKRLLVELKVNAVAQLSLPEDYGILSFDFETIIQAREKFPANECFLLVEEYGCLGPALAFAADHHLDGMDFVTPYPAGLPARLRTAGLKPAVWGANDSAAIRAAIADGIEIITTDVPQLGS
jgi:glycerophosphoryl diester phosphodiesterase